MKKFVFLAVGFEKPTPPIIEAWMKWFASLQSHVVDGGNPFGPGMEITTAGAAKLAHDKDAITGYTIVQAENMDEALKLAEGCPIITALRVYEAMQM
jgi:hypothetical protein